MSLERRSRRNISLPLYLREYDLTSARRQTTATPAVTQSEEEPDTILAQPPPPPAVLKTTEPDDQLHAGQEDNDTASLRAAVRDLKLQNRDLNRRAQESDQRLEKLQREAASQSQDLKKEIKQLVQLLQPQPQPASRSSKRHQPRASSPLKPKSPSTSSSPSPRSSPSPERRSVRPKHSSKPPHHHPDGHRSSRLRHYSPARRDSPERRPARSPEYSRSYEKHRSHQTASRYSPDRQSTRYHKQRRSRYEDTSPEHGTYRSRYESPPRRHSRHRSPVGGQERHYRGPTPNIPNFSQPNPREFARLRIALENLLPEDSTERFRYQILCDHLKLEEALLVADSYVNSRYPYSDTMEALNEQFGQPHQLALQRIAELMEGPMSCQETMLQQLGFKGRVELECGSHVSRLLGKLPHDLRAGFRRFIHPHDVPIPTLHDLADWLEFEMQVQPDSCLLNTADEILYVDRPPDSRSVLLKITKVILRNGDKCLETYAILDDGSERTILLHSAAQQLGLNGVAEDLPLRTVRQDLQVLHGAAVSFKLSPVTQPQKTYTITRAFTAKELGLAEHSHPTDTLMAKYTHLRVTPIEPVRLGPPGGPAAVKTRLGWTLQGPAQKVKQWSLSSQCYFTISSPAPDNLLKHVERLWQMDVLPWRNPKTSTRSQQDQYALDLLETHTARQDIDGINRYATPLLRASAYIAEIQRLVEAGYVVELEPGSEHTPTSWYIPHHMVQHNGKNRVVFNCSFEFQGQNLNKLLLPGPPLGPSLLAVLLRFREHSVAISSDIRGMFHQVRLLPHDCPLLRFLWRDLQFQKPPKIYEWRVLPFGTTCSPCCAIFALQKHVRDCNIAHPDVQETVLQCFYVDNCLRSLSSELEARQLVDKLQSHLADGGFELRQWASNRPSVISHLPSAARSSTSERWIAQGQVDGQESALGLYWHGQADTLSYKLRNPSYPKTTLRVIYKILASQYDPLGYLIPFTTRAKMVVQQLWAKNREWDDPDLPADLLQTWKEWERELPELPNIMLPRCYTSRALDSTSSIRDLHIFCDASEKAYGSVAYLRTESSSGHVEVAFVTARSRVAPRKQQTIPRLELCGALTGAQLASVLVTELTLPLRHVILWTDSTTVLTWLQSDSCRFKVFVGTRITEIQELTSGHQWRYVDSSNNPADDITRGKRLRELETQSRWYRGPPFLQVSEEHWPCTPPATQLDSTEFKKATLCHLTTNPLPDAGAFASLADLIEATIKASHGAADYVPSAGDYREAEKQLIQQAQEDSFPSELAHLKAGKALANNSRLLKLAPELDSAQLIRVGGRLRHSPHLSPDTVHPVVLDYKHPLSQLIIKDIDEKLSHPGPERVFAEVRRKFWILQGRQAIRRFQQRCMECRKWRAQPKVPRMADLPPSRLRLHRPAFYSTGMDCFGPYLVTIGRRREKRWGIIFKCMTTRAVHLDLLSSLDTDSFLMAFRRFSARRGKPFELISDQGTNFRGGERELRETFAALHPELQAQLAKAQVEFHFNPPNAPHFGGCWEREIRSLKQALQVTLGSQSVTEEVLRTVLVEIEGMLNSKPLGYVSSDIADLDPVTPNSLLLGRPDSSLPQVVYPESELLSRKRWRHSQLLADHFWRHFVKCYLPGLQTRQKWTTETPDLQIGTPVMIVDHQLPRAQWPVGRITNVFPGQDERIRTVEVKVGDNSYIRPVARVIQLPAIPD
ncbi:hypothetical protein WMY93_018827 [Mugilogobius chulae]|uniref:ribonuclease H n=1 Tax=Mugilogobius chulae TaxID=88201 RepID=A0AAW0NL40_9GOBI